VLHKSAPHECNMKVKNQNSHPTSIGFLIIEGNLGRDVGWPPIRQGFFFSCSKLRLLIFPASGEYVGHSFCAGARQRFW
jgi:hypothetical protein